MPKMVGSFMYMDGKADDHNFFQECERIRSEFLSHIEYAISLSCCFSKIPHQEVAILKQTMFRKAECGKKIKTINSKHDAIRSVLLCAFSCKEVLTLTQI